MSDDTRDDGPADDELVVAPPHPWHLCWTPDDALDAEVPE